MENYLTENYNLPDHRGEEAYAGWDEEFIRFKEQEKETMEQIEALILKESKKKVQDGI